MAIRMTFSSSRGSGGGRGGLLFMGIALTAFGLVLGWTGWSEARSSLGVIGFAIVVSGVWMAGLHRLTRSRRPALTVPGGLLVGWGALGAAAAALQRFWVGALLCAVPVYVGLVLLGTLPLPEWLRRTLATLRPIAPGLAFVAAGLGIAAQALLVEPNEGVPAFVPWAAAVVFVLGGLVVILGRAGGGDSILSRVLVAVFVTAFTAVAVVFPPSLLLMAPFAVLAWIAVARLVVQKATGRDPLAGWSDERILGLGCGVTLVIALLIGGAVTLRSCHRQPSPPLEAFE